MILPLWSVVFVSFLIAVTQTISFNRRHIVHAELQGLPKLSRYGWFYVFPLHPPHPHPPLQFPRPGTA